MSTSITTKLATPYRRQTPTVWQSIGRSIWSGLEATGRRRAARELRDMAQRWAPFDAALAAQLLAAAQDDSMKEEKP